MKTCPKCNETKELFDFSSDKYSKNGLRSWCKTCCNKAIQKYRRTKRGKEVRRKADMRYSRTKKGKETHKKAGAKYQKANPEKIKAKHIVSYALRTGRLTKEPCPCGETEVEGHHPDYNNPLDVEWLCTKCHTKLHKGKT